MGLSGPDSGLLRSRLASRWGHFHSRQPMQVRSYLCTSVSSSVKYGKVDGKVHKSSH